MLEMSKKMESIVGADKARKLESLAMNEVFSEVSFDANAWNVFAEAGSSKRYEQTYSFPEGFDVAEGYEHLSVEGVQEELKRLVEVFWRAYEFLSA